MLQNLNLRWFWLFAALSFDAVGQTISIEFGWIRLLPPNLGSTAAYLEINNSGEEPVNVLSVRSSVASRGEIHRSYFKDGLMHMEQLQTLQIAPRSILSMSSKGIHIMLIDLKSALEHGQLHEVCLVLAGDKLVCEVIEVLYSAPLSYGKNQFFTHFN